MEGHRCLYIEYFKNSGITVLENKYPETKDLIKKIIRPCEKNLKKIGDAFFAFSITKRGNLITHFNFIIKTKAILKKEGEHQLIIKKDTINLLRQHFRFRTC